MSFRDHPVFGDDAGEHTSGADAVIIGLHDRGRVVGASEPAEAAARDRRVRRLDRPAGRRVGGGGTTSPRP